MPKTKVVLQGGNQSHRGKTSEERSSQLAEIDPDEAIHWKHYAMLLHKEAREKEAALKAKKKIKKTSDKPATPAQKKSRDEFTKRVREAKEIQKNHHGAKSWKECMAESYRIARETKKIMAEMQLPEVGAQ